MNDLSRLAEHLDAVVPPPPDLAAVVARSRSTRQRRAVTAGVLGLAAAGVVGATLLTGIVDDGGGRRDLGTIAGTGTVSLDQGLRAYAEPSQWLYLGGRRFDARDVSFLDTDAVATPFGVVYGDGGPPVLFAPDGTRTRLGGRATGGLRATVKADSVNPWVVFASRSGDTVTATVYDLEDDAVVADREVPCDGGDCEAIVLEALDDGVVLVRTGESLYAWDLAADSLVRIGDARTRVADFRNRVLLHDGPPPPDLPDGWTAVQGAVDSQLTFDGRYVLGWSSTLEAVDGGPPLVLDRGPADGRGLAFWAIDTDGSAMVIVSTDYPKADVYDCALPSGTCTLLGSISPEHGDPQFIGTDM